MCVYVLTVKEKYFHRGTTYDECNVRRVFCLAFSGTGRTGHLQHDFYHRRNFISPLGTFLRFSMPWHNIYIYYGSTSRIQRLANRFIRCRQE